MKKILLILALTFLGLISQRSLVASPVSWNTNGGDVFLGFESTSLHLDYLVDLGQGSALASELTNNTFSPVNLNADLNTVFGAGWSTNSSANVQWGLFGLPSNKSIVYASVASGNNPPVKIGSAGLATTYSHYGALGTGYNGDIASQGLTLGVEQFVGTVPDTSTFTWTGNTPSSTPFAAYSFSIENGVGGNLDIYGTTVSSSTLLGSFTLNSSGVLSVVAVPEPSTYALFAFGAFLLVVAYRRNRSRTA